ncbi:hypothetical protein M527_06575 [Sphingobium indicum IP26]|uniref:Uncharacterized protein n=1 Tax=Sphingobium indicum F2 TaxID=1450518 RepID=A0A8E0WU34_9SPHN|nr:hypothetical protein [Sphingobium indicum]EPR09788.1 hypothetical protein M527_06575 [Sphingobium indicum IP26]KER37264.1 hypothetical protein AL00_06210 [Sphingobium indicum F2]
MRPAILWPLAAFIGTWALILIFDAWGSLHWPNPLEWDEANRQVALLLTLFAAWMGWWSAFCFRGRP